MRNCSYILLIFALLMQGAIARTLPMTISSDMLPQQQVMAPSCHETATTEIVHNDSAAHACCGGDTSMAHNCHADGEATTCSDGCSQCQAHCVSFAGLISTSILPSPLSSESVLANAIALNSRFRGVPTPPPSL